MKFWGTGGHSIAFCTTAFWLTSNHESVISEYGSISPLATCIQILPYLLKIIKWPQHRALQILAELSPYYHIIFHGWWCFLSEITFFSSRLFSDTGCFIFNPNLAAYLFPWQSFSIAWSKVHCCLIQSPLTSMERITLTFFKNLTK